MKKTKQILSAALAFLMLLSILPITPVGVSAANADVNAAPTDVNYAQKLFEDNSAEGTNMTVQYGSKYAVPEVEVAQGSAWRMSSQQIPNNDGSGKTGQHLLFILFRVDPAYQKKVAAAGGKVTLSVTYWDGFSEGTDSGHFGLTYNCRTPGENDTSHTVFLEGEYMWKTVHFELTDAVLNRIDANGNKGFRLGAWGYNGPGNSASDIFISHVQLSCVVNGVTHTVSRSLDNPERDGEGLTEVLYNSGSAYNAVGCTTFRAPGWSLIPGEEERQGWKLYGNKVDGDDEGREKRNAFLVQFDPKGEFVQKVAEAGNRVNVTITYWDGKDENPEKAGVIGFRYHSSRTGKAVALQQELTGVNEWRKVTWELTDAALTIVDGTGNTQMKIHGWDSFNHLYIHNIELSCWVGGVTYTASKVFDAESGVAGTNIDKVIYNTGSGTEPEIFTLGGIPQTKDSLWFTLEDDLREYLPSDVELTVSYFDAGTSFFSFVYDNGDSDRRSRDQVVQLTNSNTWKTHTFLLNNARLENVGGNSGYSFGLRAYQSNGVRAMGSLLISSVRIKPVDVITEITSKSNRTGNIFVGSEEIDLTLSVTGSSDAEYNLQLKILDSEQVVVKSTTQKITLDAEGTMKMDLDLSDFTQYGAFTLAAEIYDSKELLISSEEVYFSRVVQVNDAIDIFGMTVHLNRREDTITSCIETMQTAGITYIRDDYTWEDVETVKGKIIIPDGWWEKEEAAKAAGMETLGVFASGQATAGSVNGFYPGFETNGPTDPEWRAAFLNYCYEVVKQFKDAGYAGKSWQIWNEWNLENFMPAPYNVAEYYIPLFEEAAAKIKEADPTAKIILGSVSYGQEGQDKPKEFLQELLSYKSVLETIDAVSYHKYYLETLQPEATNFVVAINEIHQMIEDSCKANGVTRDIELWITETGLPTPDQLNTDNRQASHLQRVLIWGVSTGKLEKLVWYDLQNDGYDTRNSEHNFGVIRFHGDQKTPYAAKQSYVAMCALQNRIGDAEYVKELSLGEGLYAHQFRKANGNDLIAIWCDNDTTQNVALNLGDISASVTDMLGNTQTAAVNNGLLKLVISEAPQFIETKLLGELEAVEPEFQLEKRVITTPVNSIVKVNLKRTYNMASISGEYIIEAPEGWTINNTKFAASESGEVVDTIEIQIPADCVKDVYNLGVSLSNGTEVLDQAQLKVDIIDMILVNPTVVEESGEYVFYLKTDIINEYGKDSVEGTLKFTNPKVWFDDPVEIDVKVKAGANESYMIPIDNNVEQRAYPVRATFTGDDGTVIELSKTVSLFYSMEADAEITIDGVIDAEWNNTMSFQLGENNFIMLDGNYSGASAVGYTKWSQEYLYVAVAIHEEEAWQEYKGTDIWKGDSVQLGFDPGRQYEIAGMDGKYGWNKFGYAISSIDGTQMGWNWTDNKETEPLFAVVRDDAKQTTTYEIAIPWSDIMRDADFDDFSDIENIGFSLIVNDDGYDSSGKHVGRAGYLEYNSGIGNNEGTHQFGDFVLVRNNNAGGNTNEVNNQDGQAGAADVSLVVPILIMVFVGALTVVATILMWKKMKKGSKKE